ncbi:MAG: exodeoxyribonuclease V subunit alpha [Methylicorpusculum sp.]|uniref:exodeoxyribonuclease V subunit alpha n=1 Tax=Methylicorpusculum sp. TaxID=2713644 RepID=UPI0027219754|nr:exodeoxyribonuclease V subunit alpha [Methylicorpusculum sp.]MDO8939039.1 exodeoxyribonuclease V subunit alpha [Methylicorpusculum sp.]MDP2202944.1 exodeoxyribonuclease V subunit alpha [Methylicorpusculum sp.]
MNHQDSALKHIDQWLVRGWLSQLDRAFAHFLLTQDAQANEAVLWAGALLSRQLEQGEVFLDLEKLSRQPGLTLAIPGHEVRRSGNETVFAEVAILQAYTLQHWKQALADSPLISLGGGNTPLVLDGHRLYLRRYWQYQQILNASIQSRLQPIRSELPDDLILQLNSLFKDNAEQPDWQKIACALALRSRFAIITGGPGTGKTTTLTKLLALLIQLSESNTGSPRKLKVLLAAPTGKAAARVSESISQALAKLTVDDAIKQLIPKSASTLHRLLGSRQGTRQFIHHRNNPLVADIVIIDEASMIDLEMMAALLDALPETAQLILLGDKDQLASVEAGAVMGDLCRGADNQAYDPPTLNWIAQTAGVALAESDLKGSAINQQTVMLRFSHRFGEHSGIGQLARAVNAGEALKAQAILNDTATYQDLNRLLLDDPGDSRLKQLITANGNPHQRQGYRYFLDVILQQRPDAGEQFNQWAKRVLDAFDTFQVLCAVRMGPWGVEGLNQRIEQWLFSDYKLAPTTLSGLKQGERDDPFARSHRLDRWYEGRPVMVTRNDYNLGLMNGDIGITLYDFNGKLRVAFPDTGDEMAIRWISPMRLPDVETAFAMTVHKSQGSEFNHVALILPETLSPVLTRELVYTGITRAKAHFTLLESQADVFNQAVLATCK